MVRKDISLRHKVYKWVHRDGREMRCTTNEMSKILGVHSSKTAGVANPNEAKCLSVKGWFIGRVRDAEIKKKHLAATGRGESHGNFDATLRTFQHEDGREVTATTHDMRNKYGCKCGISSVVTGKAYSHRGWRLKGSVPYEREIKWTLDACIDSAAPFPTKTAWLSSCRSAYNAARKNGWLDQCCAHMARGHAVRAKSVINIDTQKAFSTAKAAGDYYGVDPSSILKVCKGHKRTTGGYHWAYVDETETTAKEG